MIDKEAQAYAHQHSTPENFLYVYEAYKDGYSSGLQEPKNPYSWILIGIALALLILSAIDVLTHHSVFKDGFYAH